MTLRNAILITAMGLGLTACGGGGDGSGGDTPEVSTSVAELRYDTGELKGRGPVDGSGELDGPWTFYFKNGQVWWEARYVDGSYDASLQWIEYNADGSIRSTSDDGPPIGAPPI